MESENIFRKKSMEAIKSPEQLTDYIRVANPGMWMALAAVIALLIGVCVWGVFGRLDSTLSAAVVSDGGRLVCYVSESGAASVEPGMVVLLDGPQGAEPEEHRILSVPATPVSVDEGFDEYTLHVGGLQRGEWVYALELDGELAEGVYSARIVTESLQPISFILN